jgi:ATP-dependent 26S proteasome regulatory subunit
MVGHTIVATIMRKGDGGTRGPFYIIVRSSAIAEDIIITISQEDYDQLHPGMLVTVQRIGWGVFSTWRLRR